MHHEKETDFTKNGYGSLDEYIVDPEVIWEMNGEFRADFEYPMFLDDSKYLINRNIVRVPVPFMQDQLFRIYRTRKTLGFIEVEARHIFYDLIDNLVEDTFIVGRNGQGAIQQLLNATQFAHKFEGLSNITSTANARMVRYNPVEALLDDGKANSFVSRWGGEILRDNFRINMLQQLGSNRGVHIEHKKDLLGYEATIDESTIATRIYPRGFDGLELPERYIDSLLLDPDHPKIKIINYSDVKAAVGEYAEDEDAIPLEDAYSLLRQYAEDEYTIHHIDEPETVVNVDFVTLNNTLEYEDLAGLQEVRQGDTVKVSVLDESFEITSRLVAFKSDPLQKNHYTGTTLGNHVLEFTSSGESIDTIRRELNEVIDEIIRVRASAGGKTQTFEVNEDPNNLNLNAHLGDLAYQSNGDEIIMWLYVEVNGERYWKEIGNTADTDENKRLIEQAIEDAKDEKERVDDEFEKVMNETEQLVEQQKQTFEAEFSAMNSVVNDVMTNADWSRSQINATIAGSQFNSLAQVMADVRSLSNNATNIANKGVQDAAEAMARAQDALAEYRNLDPGTTNLIPGTSDEWKIANHSVWYADLGRYNLLQLGLVAGDEISFSVHVIAGEYGARIRFRWEDGTDNFQNDYGGELQSGQEGTLKITTTVPDRATHIRLALGNIISGTAYESQYKRIMVVRGNKVGSWQPAPQDVQVQITDINGELQRKVSQTVFNDLNTSFEAIQSITYQNQHDIGLKASAQLVNSINQTVENHTAQINTNAYEIQQRATQQSVNNLTGRVTTAEASIITNATQIGLRATQSSVDTINSQINNIFAEFTVQSDRINSKVSMTEVNGALDVLDYENRNLIIRNDELTGSYVANDGIWGELWTRRMIHYIPVQPGERLTLTKNSGFHDNSWRLSYYDSDKNWISRYTSTSDRVTFTIPNNIYFMRASYPADAQVKLERGTRATPWSLAPEDTRSSIFHVESELTQTAEEFRLAIIQVNTGLDGKASLQAFNTLDQTVGSTVSRIGDAEGRLNSVESTANGTQQIVSGTNGLVTQISSISAGFDVLAQRSVQNILNNPRFENGMSGWTRGNEVVLESTSGSGYSFGVWTANGQRNGERRIWVNADNISDPVNLDRQGKSYNVRIKFRFAYEANPRMQFGQGNGAYFETITANGGTTVTKTFAFTATGTQTFSIYFLDNGYYRIEEVVITETGGATQGQLSVLNNAIDLAVSEGDVISRINAQANRILIQSNQIVLSAASVIFSGSAFIPNASILELNANKLTGTEADFALTRTRVLIANAVQATHIQASTSTIDKIFGTTALINQLTSKTAFIDSIRTIDLNASRITTGTLNANNVNIINMNASNIVSGTLSGANMHLNLSEGVFSTTSQINNQLAGMMTINYGRLESISNIGTARKLTLSGDQLHMEDLDGYVELTPRYIDFNNGNRTARMRFNGTNLVVDQHLGMNGNHINSVNWLRLIGGYDTTIHKHPSTDGVAIADSTKITLGMGIRDNFTDLAAFYGRIEFFRNLHMEGNQIQNTWSYGVQGASTLLTASISSLGGGALIDGTAITIGLRSGSGRSFSRVAEFYGQIHFHRNIYMNGNNIFGESDMRLKDQIVDTTQDSFSIIKALKFKNFVWKQEYVSNENYPAGQQFGLIAQEVDSSLTERNPETDIYGISQFRLIHTTAHALNQLIHKHDNTLTVASRTLLWVEDLEEDVDTLKQDMESMKDKMTKMQAKLDKLEGAA